MSTNAKSPHKAVIKLQMEIHEILPTGECSAKILTKEELAKYNLQPKCLVTVNGFDRHNCLLKTKELLEKFEKK